MQLNAPLNLPATLEPRFAQVTARAAGLDVELPAALADTAGRVFTISEFVLGAVLKAPEQAIERIADHAPLSVERLISELDLAGRSEAEAMRILRRRRQLETARIAWRDLSGMASLDQSLADLSTLADAMIEAALEHATRLLEPRHGQPVDGTGTAAPLLVLGMGKLGGRELNFSSDIDLVFAHPDDAMLPGREPEDIEPYFRRLAQTLIRLLDQVTADGFVFRVDARLRPFGASGPLAISISALEGYLAQHGRDWERYAYVKARLITGRDYENEVFDAIISPFVYRRYLDYGVFDALRQMKRLIVTQVERNDMQANIKLGSGGIREIEFIAQLFQLVRGGQEPALRERRLLGVLPKLGELGLLSADSVDQLTRAYRYLRVVENRLQALEDRQIHELPEDPERRERLAYAMDCPSWSDLHREIAAHRSAVEVEFARVAWENDEPDAPAGKHASSMLAAWEAGDLAQMLDDSALAGNAQVVELLNHLRQSGLYARMDEPSRQRLAAVVTRLVPMLASRPDPATVLGRVLTILQSICRRSAYLALLNENPDALERVLSLGGESPMLARQMAEHPLLLDELLDARLFDAPPTRSELEQSLERELSGAADGDSEARVDAIRRFQRAAVFRIAIADRLGGLPLMKVSDRLTDTAELVLECALDLAWRELEAKHGKPMHGRAGAMRESEFAVIAYGKLGGLELGYGSDLDLVFLHDSQGDVQETLGPSVVDNQRFFARLTQRLIHFLTVQTSSGRLYEIDTRLRPSGASGLMVSSFQAFRAYQREQAWTWEHQALLRSRSVAGRRALCIAFEAERREVLIEHVDRAGLRDAIIKMRDRMRRELSRGTAEEFDVKQDPGGLADIEFLIDYWVLENAPRFPDLVTYPDNVRQLEALEHAALISADTASGVKQAYLDLRARIHELALSDGGKLVAQTEFLELRSWILSVWNDVLGDDT